MGKQQSPANGIEVKVMSKYKLYYFPGRWRGEVIRMVFAVADVPFEDIRVPIEEWNTKKEEMFSGQMPELHFDGVCLPESRAIYRYVAKEHGLFGKSNLEAAKIDAVCCVMEEFMWHILTVIFPPVEGIKENLRHQFQNKICGATTEKLENILQKYNPGGNFFIGDKITLADIVFFFIFHDLVHLVCSCKVAACLTEHPTLRKIYENCLADPNLATWLNQRPEIVEGYSTS